jgi:hypothetical protein
VKNGIFIQPELKEKLHALRDTLNDALFEQQFEKSHPNPRADRYAKSDRLRDEGKNMLQSIESDVQTRLWDARSLD